MIKKILALLIFLIFLVGCISNHINVSATPTPLKPSDVSSTLTLDNNDNVPALINKLEPDKAYIFYITYEGINGKNHNLWGIDPTTGKSTLFMKNLDWFYGWSNPGNKWLLSTKNALYVANPDGSNIKKIYENQQQAYLSLAWLSDDWILINIYPDFSPPPDKFYVLDLIAEKLNDITLDDRRFFMAVSQSKKIWIQGNSNSKRIEINDLSNHSHALLDNFDITIDGFGSSGRMDFLPDGDHFIFLGSQKMTSNGNEHLHNLLSESISDSSVKTLFRPERDAYIPTFRISPNGRYVAFTYQTNNKTTINFLNLETTQIDYSWVYPYRLNSNFFEWSPDSRFITLPYVDSGANQIPVIDNGIQVMDITNGKTKLVLNQNVQIIGWHLYIR